MVMYHMISCFVCHVLSVIMLFVLMRYRAILQLLSWPSGSDDHRQYINVTWMFYKVFTLAAGNELNTSLHYFSYPWPDIKDTSSMHAWYRLYFWRPLPIFSFSVSAFCFSFQFQLSISVFHFLCFHLPTKGVLCIVLTKNVSHLPNEHLSPFCP